MAATDPGSEPGPAIVATENNTTPQNITIAEEGDVILVLDDGKKRIRVSAALLSMASSVFKAMLGPHFLEGQVQRSPENPQHIHLPEDDPEAMVTLSKLVHFDTPDDSTVGPRSLRKVAVVADKYDCTQAIGLQAESLLNRHVRTMAFCRRDFQEQEVLPLLACLATSAYLLRRDAEFGHFTRCMVFDVLGSYSTITEIEGCEGFPISVLLGLEEQRTMTRDALVSGLYARTSGVLEGVISALGCDQWPPAWASTSLRSMIERLYQTKDIRISQNLPETIVISSAEVTKLCDTMRKLAYGVCLPCARQDKGQSRCDHVRELMVNAIIDCAMGFPRIST
ncbi:hypothetical protein LTR97_010696 [Elasticomyces elasticus]|uniref:BTB domain-containing protein n=1 Tax=Elasticomyces elasticus TaxID=574655 RepID=A0AAN7ZLA3_9PEZI|nr:hypothetical protein LTR97_010696 [Elasticomyces elasticus]